MNERTDNLGYFIPSEHPDCADDHKDYQGKIYIKDIGERLNKRINTLEAFINQKE